MNQKILRLTPAAVSINTRISQVTVVLLLVVGLTGRAGIQVVNVIPYEWGGETDQNSEPSIAVQPVADNQGQKQAMMISAFGSIPKNPYFLSTDGGTTWTNFQTLDHSDTTVDWGLKAYAGRLTDSVTVDSSSSPQSGIPLSKLSVLAPAFPDQPRLVTATVGNIDHLYVGLTAGSLEVGDAQVYFSLNGGIDWNIAGLDQNYPPNDGPYVRVAVAKDGQTVYGLFERWTPAGNGDTGGDVIVVRDDNQGLNNFQDLGNGSVVASATFPTSDSGGTSLGSERLNGDCSIAVHPCDPGRVYVAFTEVAHVGNSDIPRVQVFQSSDYGTNWTNVLTIGTNSALPSLAVAVDTNNCQIAGSTVGLLYTALAGGINLETHFLEADATDFTSTSDVVLARFLNDQPAPQGPPYIGDYEGLVASGDIFYGTFSASGDPDPSHFPSGVYYQRSVTNLATHVVQHNFKLKNAGTLCLSANNPQTVRVSIDPFFFEATPTIVQPPFFTGGFLPDFPLSPEILMRIYWLPDPAPGDWLGTIESRTSLAPQAGGAGDWAPVPGSGFQLTNGQATVTLGSANGIDPSQGSQFFRVHLQQSATSQFTLQPAAGAHGGISPSNAVTVTAGQAQSFVAVPDASYQVDVWYLDGRVAQIGGTTFALTNVQEDHLLTASFTPNYDLALTKIAMPNPVAVASNITYTITVANTGIETATNITVVDALDPGVSVTSVNSSISGACSLGSTNILQCTIPVLARGDFATITVVAVPTVVGMLTNTATASGRSDETDLSNNSDSAIVSVQTVPQITTQPQSQTNSPGSSATFTVAANGTPNLSYQWYYNGSFVAGATDTSLTLTNVTASQVGSYSVIVKNEVGEAESNSANLQIQ